MNQPLPQVSVKKILYATDLSETARFALAYATDLANLYRAQLVLLHVMDEVPQKVDKWVVGYLDAHKWDEIKQRNEEETEDLLTRKKRGKQLFRDVLEGVKQQRGEGKDEPSGEDDEVVVRRGNPASRILEVAEEKGCDMIVMGTHGHGTFLDAMMGSTAKRVVKRAKVPVLVVRIP